jgi:DNA polymerase I-like protein with 3'-5' exonuclease and polymerase domains
MQESIAPKVKELARSTFPNLDAAKVLSIDIESYDPNLQADGPGFIRGDAHMIGVAVSTGDGFSEYFPTRHLTGENYRQEDVIAWLGKQVHGKPMRPIVGANLSYDLEGLHFAGLKDVKNPIWDIQVAGPLLDENADSFSLETLSQKYLGIGKNEDGLTAAARVFKVDPKRGMRNLSPKYVAPYAIGDTTNALEVMRKQWVELGKEGLLEVFHKESRILPILLDMRIRGVRMDIPAAEKLECELMIEAGLLQTQLWNIAGFNVEVWAAASLKKLCRTLGIVNHARTDTGAESFTGEALKNLNHPAMVLVDKIRELDKLRKTFVRGYVLDRHVNGRLHGQFHQLRGDETGARTGRLSSSKPNLTNLPRDKRIRSLFLPDEGEQFYACDYSAQELRVLAHFAYSGHYTGSQKIHKAYHDNPKLDQHTWTAGLAFGGKESEVTKAQRTLAKILALGSAYGMQGRKMAFTLGLMTKRQMDDKEPIPAEAVRIMNAYHAALPYVSEIGQDMSWAAETQGFIRTLWGRKRRFPGGQFSYKALNALIQGSSADMLKQSVLDIHDAGLSGCLRMLVHDEIDLSVQNAAQAEQVCAIMESSTRLTIPVIAEGKLGENWGECK